MAEPPIINPNPANYFMSLLSPVINGKHPITYEKSLDLKSFGLIIFRCRKPIVYVTKKSNLDHIIFLFLIRATDCDNSSRIFHFDRSTILCFELGRLVVTLVPRISTINPPVKKVADADSENSNNAPYQHGVQHNHNIKIFDNGEEGANNGGNDNESDGNYGNGNGGDHYDDDEHVDFVARIKQGILIGIYRVDMNVNNWNLVIKPVIWTEIIANDYESWEDLAMAMHQFYVNSNFNRVTITHDTIDNINPSNCWPGHQSAFGFATIDGFEPVNWLVTPLKDVQDVLNGFITLTIIM